ncbi:ABC transporter substrate-binding protein [Arthrobacter sp. K5]|uniref:ABC transporter substrate-binding protein n=1 Tax=Arthrobacter sp. K5 TaxID=2839623 RepID=A0AAU8EYD6_9MICC
MVNEDRYGRTGKGRKVAAGLAAATLLLTGCSSGNDFGSGGAAGSGAAQESVVSTLDRDLQAAYANTEVLTGSTPYGGDWKPKGPPPWTIGYASPYSGNSWQTKAMKRLTEEVIPAYKRAGLVKEVIVTQSNLDDTVQNQQIRQLVDQGVDVLIACCSSNTALNQSIQYAYDKGVPFVSFSGHVDSPYVISALTNYREAGRLSAKSVFDKIGGKGNVLDVLGVPGAANAADFEKGVRDALAEYPDVKIVGTVTGQWSAPVTKTEVQKFLATNTGKIDGIVVQPASATGALQALQQSGRPIVPINIGGETGAACYWVKNPDFVGTGYHLWPPGEEIALGVDVAVRTLQGQGPKIQSIVRNPEPFTVEDAAQELGPDCDINADGWLEPKKGEWLSGKQLDKYFTKPADPLSSSK